SLQDLCGQNCFQDHGISPLPRCALTGATGLRRGTMPPSMNVKNSTVLVTGGSAGIGQAIAASLAGAGARVAITGRDERKLTAAAAALGAHPIRADVSKEADVIRTYDEFLRTFGHLDVL